MTNIVIAFIFSFKEEKEIDQYDIGKLCTLLQKHKKEK